MRIAVDTNVLVRAMTDDEPKQSAIARAELEQAEAVLIATPALCELAWVLSRAYRLPRSRIADAIRRLIESENVSADLDAVKEGLAHLDAGGDFADGAIAHGGRRMGAASFDRKAVEIVQGRGETAGLL